MASMPWSISPSSTCQPVRERAAPASVRAFLGWMDANPNADYDEYAGPREELTAGERGELF